MKVLGICCSPRKEGNTEMLIREALAGAEAAGAQTELSTLRDKDIRFCDGCRSCDATGKCHIKDDMQIIYRQVLAADGLIFGSPSYFQSASGQAKVLIDRLVSLHRKNLLRDKVGGVIVAASRTGHGEVRNQFCSFFDSTGMVMGGFVRGFAKDKGQIAQDPSALAAARDLGKRIVAIHKVK